MTQVVQTAAEARGACDRARAESKRVGLVPTMGALHEAHLDLVRDAKRNSDYVAVSIFVNPLQFGPEEDFDCYPRTFEHDLEQCRHYGVDLIFAPDIQSMYPPGFQTHVNVGELTERLEGTHRPGHFQGVTTVVAKLFHAIGPCRAVFGRKDYQQWKVLERMVLDLDMPVQVVARPTVREPDGLALSSRNRYLSAEQRRRALGLVQGVRAACRAWHDGERNAEALLRLARDPVEFQFDRIDYVDIADPETLQPLEGSVPGRALIAAAAHLGSTRLIDNAVLGEDAP